jgi:L-aminopeptidase/D-esterase-like protein
VSAAGGANDSLTAVVGLRVGHWSDRAAATGCTVVLAPDEGAPASGLVLGAAPGGRETDLLAPEKTVPAVHALVLTGGSAFGLDAAGGTMAWLEARGVGFATPYARVPIVPAAVLYDLGVGRADVRPDAAAGAAAADAAHDGPVEMGRVGVGTGATVGKLRGMERAVRSGVGSAALRVGGVTVAALAVSNAVGALVDPDDGSPVAGEVVPAAEVADRVAAAGTNTSLVVVATDARLDKAACRALAPAGHVGVARVTRPSHTASDGDTVFVLATGRAEARSPAALGPAVQEVVARALLRGARAAAADG